jgi:hypothetical protein
MYVLLRREKKKLSKDSLLNRVPNEGAIFAQIPCDPLKLLVDYFLPFFGL